MGLDQIMVNYNHFTVLKCKIIVVGTNNAATGTAVLCVRQDADSTAITVIDRIVELGGCQMVSLGVLSQKSEALSLTVDIGKLQGVNRSAISADPSLQGSAAAAPSEITYLHVQAWNTAAISTTIQCDVILEMTAQFSEPRDATQSISLMKNHLDVKGVWRPSRTPAYQRGSKEEAKVDDCGNTTLRPVISFVDMSKYQLPDGWIAVRKDAVCELEPLMVRTHISEEKG